MKSIPSILNNTQLKLIALISMFTDHLCLLFFPFSDAAMAVRLTIGRMAMPIFAFLLVEGFFHSKNRVRYWITLMIFALISEPVFDLAMYGSPFDFRGQNVLFSLGSGLLMLIIIEKLNYGIYTYLQYAVVAAFIAMAWFLKLDHDIAVIAMIAIFYYFHWHSIYIQSFAACMAAAAIYLAFGTLLAAVPIAMYNGQRGRLSSAGKYFFYIFYPAHLLILYFLTGCLT